MVLLEESSERLFCFEFIIHDHMKLCKQLYGSCVRCFWNSFEAEVFSRLEQMFVIEAGPVKNYWVGPKGARSMFILDSE
jgi:hypothetical protein